MIFVFLGEAHGFSGWLKGVNFLLYPIIGPGGGLSVFENWEMSLSLLLGLEGAGSERVFRGAHYLVVYVPMR